MKRKKSVAKKSSARRTAKKPAARAVSKKTSRRAGAGTTKSGGVVRKPAATAAPTASKSKAQALAKYSQTGAPWWKAHL